MNRPAQATFIHVNTPSAARCPGFSGSCSGTLLVGIPFGYYLLCFSTWGGERQTREQRRQSARRLRTMDRACRPPFAAAFSRLGRLGKTAPNLNLSARPAEVRGEPAAPYSLPPRGFRALTTRGLPLRHAPSRSVLSRRAPAPLRPAACSRTCQPSPGSVCLHLLPATPVRVGPPAGSSVRVSGPSHPLLHPTPSALLGSDSSPQYRGLK